jgi:tetratricopeptide (TPR) repeat protein
LHCTRCGTENPINGNYCSECGKKLIVESLELEIVQQVPPGQVDENAVTELVYETLKLYERDEIEAAFVKCKEALSLNPKSPSGRSLLGMIYEKKAEAEAAKGNAVDAEEFLRAAVHQLERVMEANPGSIADQGKLEELRRRLGDPSRIVARRRPKVHEPLIAAVKRVPVPVAASIGAALLVFLLMALLLRGGGKQSRPDGGFVPMQSQTGQTQVTQQPQMQPGQPIQPGTVVPQQPAPPAWTYRPTAPPSSLPPRVYWSVPENNYEPRASAPVPSLPATTTISPYPVEQPAEQSPPPQPATRNDEPVRVPPVSVQTTPPSDRARAALAKGDYDGAASAYQEAISRGEDTAENRQQLGMALYNQGKKSAALSQFQRAVQLYMDRKAKGIDAASADEGIKTCKTFIEFSKE